MACAHGVQLYVRLILGDLVAYSQYFTIINEDDGPILDSATCPVERGIARPQFANNTDPEDRNGDGTGGDGSGSPSGSNGGKGGISTSTLAVAIVVPIVVLLILFGLLLWFGIRRGWFVKLANKQGHHSYLTHDNTAGFGQSQSQSQPTNIATEKRYEAVPTHSEPRELHADHRPWEAEVRPVHQLEGDERGARYGNGYMRGS